MADSTLPHHRWLPAWLEQALKRTNAPAIGAECQTLTLSPGQEVLLWLDRGAVLHVHLGQMDGADAPRFWFGPAWRDSWTLQRGQVRVVARRGWVRLTAGPGRCELSARRPAAPHYRPRRPC